MDASSAIKHLAVLKVDMKETTNECCVQRVWVQYLLAQVARYFVSQSRSADDAVTSQYFIVGIPRNGSLHLQHQALEHYFSNYSISRMKAYVAVPATLALVYRAWSHQSLTPAGIVVAALTAVAHAVHPWSLPFALLIVFFLAGTRVTKVTTAPAASAN